ncbi:MFS transporter [Kitasatospora sp. NPDC057500]|uniref:MFS transporter n=1 Tax=Kitasatospora sp. NPDC057500 TaxID=3346151 RepID=UPI0036AB7C75
MTTQLSPAVPTGTAPPAHQSPRRAVISTGVGNAVESYDWAIYATFAPFFAKQLFDPANQTSAVLQTLAIFAVGFVTRPLGGFVFGWIGDRLGRRKSMTLSIGLAATGSLMISLAPTFGSVGAFASLFLLLARLVQGLAHGGELPSAQTYLSEIAPRERRGLWSSMIYVSGTTGVISGTLLGAVLTQTLTKSQMNDFGWRIPFLIGALLGLYGLVMRARMPETEAFEGIREEAGKAAGPSLIRSIIDHRKQGFQVVGMTVGFTVIYYVWAVAAPAYAATSLKIDTGHALWAGTSANLVFIASLPFWGKLSDRIGRRPVMTIGCVGAAALHFPMTWLLRDSAWQLAVSMAVMLTFVGALAAVAPATYAELFPARIRTVGVAVPYAFCVAAFGGTAAYLQTLFTEVVKQPWLFNLYAVLLLLVTALVVRSLPETKGKDLG